MIFGKTTEDAIEAKTKIGDRRSRFAYLPRMLPDGRWIWWEWVTEQYTLREHGESCDHWKIIDKGAVA